jgi:hypothetical protein
LLKVNVVVLLNHLRLLLKQFFMMENNMTALKNKLEQRIQDYDFWATRCRYGAKRHNNASLWVLACMKIIATFRTHPLIPKNGYARMWSPPRSAWPRNSLIDRVNFHILNGKST